MDAYLIVDPDSRNITIPEIESAFGVYGDNNAERKYFKSPRIVGNGIDLTECYLYVNYISASTKIGQILCDVGDVPNGTATEDEIVFSWPITRNVLDKNVSGEIFFAVQAKTKTGDTVFTTRKAKGNCYESIEGTEAVAEEYADVILQLLSRMDKVEENIGLEVDNYFKENPVVTSEYLTQTLQPVKDDVSSIKEDLDKRTHVEKVVFNMTDGAVLLKTGTAADDMKWAVSDIIDVNGCDYINIKGTFANLVKESPYTHLVFFSYQEISPDYKVQYVTLAEEEESIVDKAISIPKGAHCVVICNSSANKDTVNIEKYYHSLIEQDLSNLMDLTPLFFEGNMENNGLSLKFSDSEVVFNGTGTSNVTFLLYSSSNQFFLKNGDDYIVDFVPLTNNENVYLQVFCDNTSIALINSQRVDKQLVKIPQGAQDVFVRFIAPAGTYKNESYFFCIRKKVNCYSNLFVSTAKELYDFMKDPKPFTTLYLDPMEYDLYTGLFESDINNNIALTTESFLHDVIIYGNNSKILLNIPGDVLKAKGDICNTYSALNVSGNIEVNDLEIECKNTRYTLHEESIDKPLWFNTVHKYKNCKFVYSGYDYSTVNANTVGCGFSKGQIVEFINCEFVNKTPSDYTFYVHGRYFNISRLAFIGCIFNDRENAFSIGLSQYTGNGEKSSVLIDNSYIGKVKLFTQPNGLKQNQWAITAINSYITQILTDDSTELLYTPKSINTISGTIN